MCLKHRNICSMPNVLHIVFVLSFLIIFAAHLLYFYLKDDSGERLLAVAEACTNFIHFLITEVFTIPVVAALASCIHIVMVTWMNSAIPGVVPPTPLIPARRNSPPRYRTPVRNSLYARALWVPLMVLVVARYPDLILYHARRIHDI